MKIKKESFEMFYQLVFGIIAVWIIIVFPKRISIIPLMIFGITVFVIRVYKREQELNKKEV